MCPWSGLVGKGVDGHHSRIVPPQPHDIAIRQPGPHDVATGAGSHDEDRLPGLHELALLNQLPQHDAVSCGPLWWKSRD